MTVHESLAKGCALCSADVTNHPVIDGLHAFCCAGCHTVFNILSAKNQLEDFAHHPLFLQALRCGVISNPALLEHIRQQRASIDEAEREKLHLEIANMWCPSCAEIIRLMLLKERGVVNCIVDYATDLASVEFCPRYIGKDKIIDIIKQFGYQPQALDSSERKAVSSDLYLRFGVAAFCSLNIMMFAYPLYATYFSYDGEGYGQLFAWLSLVAALPVMLYSAWPIWRRFGTSLQVGIFGMETLVAIGVGSAFALSLHELLVGGLRVYFDSMSVVIVFVLLGKIIEAKAKFSAKASLMRLSRATPRRGRKLFADGTLNFVLMKDIAKGDLLVAYPGEKIVLDGIVSQGTGNCDESLMTGEALPVAKMNGRGVLAGTIVVQGHLTYQVTSSPEETALHKIIEMVERDIGHKSVYVRAADQIVRWFVPAVLAIAAATALFCVLFPWGDDANPNETALLRALSILLISCPCAIGIAAPTAESHLLNGLAALGAIVRNRGCLPFLGKESVVIFDKTGTVTEGRFRVHAGLDALPARERRVLASLAAKSTHPVACAVAAAAGSADPWPLTDLAEIIGHGIKGVFAGHSYCLGSARFLQQQGIAVIDGMAKAHSADVLSQVYFGKDHLCLAQLLLGDQVKEEFKDVLAALAGTRTILLSGDAEGPVAAVAHACGFAEWRSLCTPLEKRAFVDSLRAQGAIVCMIGDGINDAPALTAANIGISVVSASDMSIQVSDILLTTDRLTVLPKMRQLALRGQKIVRQNLFWAFFYNVVGIFLAVFGWLSPIFAAVAMSLSSVTVLFNARRLGK